MKYVKYITLILGITFLLAGCDSNNNGESEIEDLEPGTGELTVSNAFSRSLPTMQAIFGTVTDPDTGEKGTVIVLVYTDPQTQTNYELFLAKRGDRPGKGEYSVLNAYEMVENGDDLDITTIDPNKFIALYLEYSTTRGFGFSGYSLSGTVKIITSADAKLGGTFSLSIKGMEIFSEELMTISVEGKFNAVGGNIDQYLDIDTSSPVFLDPLFEQSTIVGK